MLTDELDFESEDDELELLDEEDELDEDELYVNSFTFFFYACCFSCCLYFYFSTYLNFHIFFSLKARQPI